MKMNFRADRPTIVVGSSLGLVLVLALYLVFQFWFLRQDFADEIETIQPRTARLLGMVESVDQLELASGVTHNMLAELVYAVDQDSAMTAAALQQSIRELMTDVGLSVSGSQILPQPKSQAFDRISLDISAEGNIDALDEALSSLELMRPLVFVESLKVQPRRSRGRRRSRGGQPEDTGGGDARKLTARFQLFSLRLKD
jgi:general secretion pathway protein M